MNQLTWYSFACNDPLYCIYCTKYALWPSYGVMIPICSGFTLHFKNLVVSLSTSAASVLYINRIKNILKMHFYKTKCTEKKNALTCFKNKKWTAFLINCITLRLICSSSKFKDWHFLSGHVNIPLNINLWYF